MSNLCFEQSCMRPIDRIGKLIRVTDSRCCGSDSGSWQGPKRIGDSSYGLRRGCMEVLGGRGMIEDVEKAPRRNMEQHGRKPRLLLELEIQYAGGWFHSMTVGALEEGRGVLRRALQSYASRKHRSRGGGVRNPRMPQTRSTPRLRYTVQNIGAI
ncbi:hypothetical protein BU15DRAFT_68204 [Melanogaster broomeanus]|nr:hypothetical protein BU15DRAFT_68204 [Melanogaster broomeanus]